MAHDAVLHHNQLYTPSKIQLDLPIDTHAPKWYLYYYGIRYCNTTIKSIHEAKHRSTDQYTCITLPRNILQIWKDFDQVFCGEKQSNNKTFHLLGGGGGWGGGVGVGVCCFVGFLFLFVCFVLCGGGGGGGGGCL